MTNAEKFKEVFGIYATEMWAMTEENFLKWLNADRKTEPQKNYALYNGCSRCGARDRCEDAYQSHSHLCNNYGVETPWLER